MQSKDIVRKIYLHVTNVRSIVDDNIKYRPKYTNYTSFQKRYIFS